MSRKKKPKVGVFVCHCGANIGSVVDVPSHGRIRPDPAQRRPRRGEPVRLRDQLRPGDIGHDPGKGPEPRGRRGLHAEDARAAVPRHAAGGGDQSVFLRHGEYPGALLLGPLQGEGGGHPEGEGHRPDVGGAGLPSGAAAGIRAAGQQGGAGGRRRRGRHDQRSDHGQPGIRGLPGREGCRPGRHGAEDPLHAGRAGCSGLPERSQEEGLSAPADPCHHRRHHHGRLRLRRAIS